MPQLPAEMSNLTNALTGVGKKIASMSGDDTYLRLQKDGAWVYGADDMDVEPGSLWAVNPSTIKLGWVAWADNDKKGEVMALITDAPVMRSDLDNVGADWKAQISIELVCVEGEDEGTRVVYNASSKGAMRELSRLVGEIGEQVTKDPVNIVPIVTLYTDSYKHKKYGKIYTPVIDIEKFVDMEATEIPADEVEDEEPEDEPEEKPRRRRVRGKRAA